MKTLAKLLFVTLFLLQLSCNKVGNDIDLEILTGGWVHTVTQTDTIDFDIGFFASEKAFQLKRGKEVREGHILPKIGSDIYRYEIKGDSIYLNGMLSSYSGSYIYFFKMDEDKQSFKIGSFAPFTGGLMVNTFKRIK